jgi:hypothetical protein
LKLIKKNARWRNGAEIMNQNNYWSKSCVR